jgi:hypothetical protein
MQRTSILFGSGNSLLGDKAEAHLEEGGDHGGPDEGAVASCPLRYREVSENHSIE